MSRLKLFSKADKRAMKKMHEETQPSILRTIKGISIDSYYVVVNGVTAEIIGNKLYTHKPDAEEVSNKNPLGSYGVWTLSEHIESIMTHFNKDMDVL